VKKLLSRARDNSHAFVTIVVLLIVWEVAVRAFGVREFLLPAPSRILLKAHGQWGYLLKESFSTLQTTLYGFGFALVLGVTAAIGIVSSRFLDKTLYALLVALNAVPKVALAPLFVIWMGTGSMPKVTVAMLIAIFPILIDTVLGLRSTESDMLDMARVNRASKAKILWKIRVPNALPSVFAGMKVGISFALVGTIVGEFVAGESGLGHVILVAQGSFDTPTVFLALGLLGLLGVLIFKAIELLEEHFLKWHASQREKAALHAVGI
jgi:NitT/TauT family transport system permease protein